MTSRPGWGRVGRGGGAGGGGRSGGGRGGAPPKQGAATTVARARTLGVEREGGHVQGLRRRGGGRGDQGGCALGWATPPSRHTGAPSAGPHPIPAPTHRVKVGPCLHAHRHHAIGSNRDVIGLHPALRELVDVAEHDRRQPHGRAAAGGAGGWAVGTCVWRGPGGAPALPSTRHRSQKPTQPAAPSPRATWIWPTVRACQSTGANSRRSS